MAQVKKAEVRESIHAAAASLFTEHGYARATINLIANAAGMAPSNVHVYFESKLAIMFAIYEPWFRQHLDDLEQEVAALKSPEEAASTIAINADALITCDRDFSRIDNSGDSEEERPSFADKVRSRLFRYIRTEHGLMCLVNIVIEDTKDDWGKLPFRTRFSVSEPLFPHFTHVRVKGATLRRGQRIRPHRIVGVAASSTTRISKGAEHELSA